MSLMKRFLLAAAVLSSASDGCVVEERPRGPEMPPLDSSVCVSFEEVRDDVVKSPRAFNSAVLSWCF